MCSRNASVHCQPVGMLTDDAPDSSPSPFSSPSVVTFRLRQTPPHPPTLLTQHTNTEHGGKKNQWNTEPDYSLRAVIEYVTNTLRIALGNQIKKWIIYKDMEYRSDRAERVEEYTYNKPQTTLQVWSWHFPTVVIHFYNAHKYSPFVSWYWNMTHGKITWKKCFIILV